MLKKFSSLIWYISPLCILLLLGAVLLISFKARNTVERQVTFTNFSAPVNISLIDIETQEKTDFVLGKGDNLVRNLKIGFHDDGRSILQVSISKTKFERAVSFQSMLLNERPIVCIFDDMIRLSKSNSYRTDQSENWLEFPFKTRSDLAM